LRLLLDTHVLLWALADSPRLSARARELLADVDNECWVSSASVWEIAIKVRLGKHSLGWPLASIEDVIDEAGFRALPVTLRHAAAIEQVGSPHGDPFDRLLLAQCEVETLRLLTADAVLKNMPAAIGC
jgi:PIN domain nuclease of toxin-antitoxin system